MDKKITEFLKSQHVMSLCVCDENAPYACSAFYAFCDDFAGIVFASDESTKHMKIARKNPSVALNIALQTRIMGRIKGVQALGILRDLEGLSDAEQKAYKSAYFRAFPYALAMKPKLFVITLSWAKLTNNALGKKIIWEKNSRIPAIYLV